MRKPKLIASAELAPYCSLQKLPPFVLLENLIYVHDPIPTHSEAGTFCLLCLADTVLTYKVLLAAEECPPPPKGDHVLSPCGCAVSPWQRGLSR